eukprot:7293381-Prymnesium_polylepis.1
MSAISSANARCAITVSSRYCCRARSRDSSASCIALSKALRAGTMRARCSSRSAKTRPLSCCSSSICDAARRVIIVDAILASSASTARWLASRDECAPCRNASTAHRPSEREATSSLAHRAARCGSASVSSGGHEAGSMPQQTTTRKVCTRGTSNS